VNNTIQYLVAIDGFMYGNTSFINTTLAHSNVNTNEIQSVDMNFEQDALIIPNKTYTALITILKTIPGLVCTNASVAGCYYNGLCNDIIPKFQSFMFSFNDGQMYTLPYQSFLVEDANALVCRVKIARGFGNVMSLGTPWFKTFYTVYDMNYLMMNFGLGINAFGSIQ